jgi:hypothetical protein
MDRTENSILELLEEDDGQTEAELIRHLGWSWPDPQSRPLLPILEEMQRAGLLRCDGVDRWWRRVTATE